MRSSISDFDFQGLMPRWTRPFKFQIWNWNFKFQPKFHYADFLETSPWQVFGSFGEVGDLSRGSRRHALCYGEVTGMFRGFNPSRHVEMALKTPVTSGQLASLRRGNGESATTRTNQRGRQGLVADLSACHGEVGIAEFGLNRATQANSAWHPSSVGGLSRKKKRRVAAVSHLHRPEGSASYIFYIFSPSCHCPVNFLCIFFVSSLETSHKRRRYRRHHRTIQCVSKTPLQTIVQIFANYKPIFKHSYYYIHQWIFNKVITPTTRHYTPPRSEEIARIGQYLANMWTKVYIWF